jgi:O-antigen ligase
VLLVLGVLVLIISQTRSLWLGFITGTFVVLVFHLRSGSLRRWLPVIAVSAVVLVAAAAMIAPQLFRLSDADGNVGYRMSQAVALWGLFIEHPIIGSGYGAVTAVAAASGPSYSHEMDIIDLLRKLGIVGFSLYAGAFVMFARSAWQVCQSRPDSPEVGTLLYTLAVVFTVGFFNPYATASLGIGAIVVAVVTVEFSRLRAD